MPLLRFGGWPPGLPLLTPTPSTLEWKLDYPSILYPYTSFISGGIWVGSYSISWLSSLPACDWASRPITLNFNYCILSACQPHPQPHAACTHIIGLNIFNFLCFCQIYSHVSYSRKFRGIQFLRKSYYPQKLDHKISTRAVYTGHDHMHPWKLNCFPLYRFMQASVSDSHIWHAARPASHPTSMIILYIVINMRQLQPQSVAAGVWSRSQ